MHWTMFENNIKIKIKERTQRKIGRITIYYKSTKINLWNHIAVRKHLSVALRSKN